MQDVIDLMNAYNVEIARYKIAEIYFDKETNEQNIQNATEKLKGLTFKIESKIKKFKSLNVEITDTEILEGFNIEYRTERFKRYNY